MCVVVLNLGQWFRKCFYFYFSIFSCGGHFVYKSGTICIILVESIMRNIFVGHYFEFGSEVLEQTSFKLFFLILARVAILFNGVFRTNCTISKEDFIGNVCVKLF